MNDKRLKQLESAYEVWKEWLISYGRNGDTFSFVSWFQEEYKKAKEEKE